MSLTREDLLAGRIDDMVRDAEAMGLMSWFPPEQRDPSRRAILGQFGDAEIWVFGYGSLMWNPCIHYQDRQTARLYGYHRSFCLQTPLGRGSPEHPGLVLALETGGSCQGIAFRVDPKLADHEFTLIWNREMVSGAYVPRLVQIHTPLGKRQAVTFVINRRHPRYLPALEPQQAAAIIAKAAGKLGSCAEYLYSTVEHLDQLGVGDGPMHQLKRLVEAAQSAVQQSALAVDATTDS